MKISVIVPAFNEEQFLGKTLAQIKAAAGALANTGWGTELIVCDNNSTDRTAEIARAAGANVVFEPVNQISRARNSGAAAATGDGLVFVDADSHPSAGVFADLAKEIQSGNCIAGGATIRWDQKLFIMELLTPLVNLGFRWRRMLSGAFIFIETAAFRNLGGFSNEAFGGEDVEFARRLKHLARTTRKRFVILHRHPVVTSARRMRLNTARQQIGQFRLLYYIIFDPHHATKDREAARIWYDGRRWQCMIAPLAKFIDWSVLQAGYAMLSLSMLRESTNERDLKLEQAVQFLNGPDFIPAESQPAELDFGSDALGVRFRFPTPRPCEFAENNVVHGWLYRCADAWQERPTIVFLHGASDVPGHQFGFHLFTRRFQRAGFNAATLELPYHFQRRPSQYGLLDTLRQYGPGISQDYLQMAKTYAQAVAEVRSLSGWLLAEGSPAVALAGGSLGAYLAGLTACRDMRLASIVMALPVARVGDLVSQAEQALGRRVREAVRRRRAAFEALDKTPFNLTSTRPAISKENVLLIEGMHDLLASSPVELWQSWGQPEIWRLPHGHISTALISLMPGLPGRILRWLAPRLEAGGKNNA